MTPAFISFDTSPHNSYIDILLRGKLICNHNFLMIFETVDGKGVFSDMGEDLKERSNLLVGNMNGLEIMCGFCLIEYESGILGQKLTVKFLKVHGKGKHQYRVQPAVDLFLRDFLKNRLRVNMFKRLFPSLPAIMVKIPKAQFLWVIFVRFCLP